MEQKLIDFLENYPKDEHKKILKIVDDNIEYF